MKTPPNNEALNYAYALAKENGYEDSIEDYTSLMETNKEALDYSYALAKENGYEDSIEDYKSLILPTQPPTPQDPKKAQADVSGGLGLASADTTSSSESVSPEPSLIEQTTSQKFQDEATKELIEEYEKKGIKDFNISQEDINKRAEKIYQDAQKLDELDENFWSESWKKIKSASNRVMGGFAGLPSSFNQIMFNILASDEQLATINKLPTEQRRKVINAMSSPITGMSSLGLVGDEIRKDFIGRAKSIEDEMIKFDTALVDDISKGNLKQAGLRIASEGIGSIPYIVQGMLGAAGLATIVSNATSEKLIELQDEGYDLSGRTTTNALVSGSAEGLLEVFTLRLGRKLHQAMKNTGDEGAMQILEGIKTHLLKAPLKEGASEGATAIIQNLSDAFIQGKEVEFDKAWKEVVDASLVGGAVGKGIGASTFVVETVNNIKNDVKLNKVLQSDTNDYKTIKDAFIPSDSKEISIDKIALASNRNATKELDKDLTKSVNNGEIDQEQADIIKKEFLETRDALHKTRNTIISDKDRARVVEIIREKEKLKKEIKESDEVLSEPKIEKVQELNKELREISKKVEEDFDKPIKDVKRQIETKELREIPKKVEEPVEQPIKETEINEEDQQFQKEYEDYKKSVEIGIIDESFITELEVEEANRLRKDAEEDMKREEELFMATESSGDKMMFIHENLRSIKSKNFDRFGDSNLRRDNKAFNIMYGNKNATPLDSQAQEMSEMFGSEITEQDIIDYVNDRQLNPEKYKKSKDKIKKLEKATRIDLASSSDAYKTYMNLDASKKSFDALDKMKDEVLSEDQINIIKKYLKLKQDATKQPQADKGASRSVQQNDGVTTRSKEGTRQTEKPTDEQILDDIKKGRIRTFVYDSESEIPDIFNDRANKFETKVGVTSKKKVQYRVTIPESEANYLLSNKKEEKPKVKTTKEKSKEIADTVRKLKITSSAKDAMSRLNSRPTAVFELAWDGSVETVAKTIELTGDIAQAIEDGIKNLKKSEWYKSLSEKGKQDAEQLFRSNFEDRLKDEEKTFDENLTKEIEDVRKKESENETKKTLLEKINNVISEGRKRTFGFINKTTSPIINEIETIGSRLSELQLVSLENVKSFKKIAKKALEKYQKQNKLDKKQAEEKLTGMINDLMRPTDRNTNTADAYNELSKISKPLADKVIAMRTHIDSLSNLIIEDPSFDNMSVGTKQTIIDNIGNYVSENYLFFKNKDFKPSETAKVIAVREMAKELMVDENLDYKKAIEKANKIVNKLLNSWEDTRNPKAEYKSIKTNPALMRMDSASLKAKARKPNDKKLWEEVLDTVSEKYPKLKKNHKRILTESVDLYEELGGTFRPLPQYLKDLLGQIKLPEAQYINTMMSVGKMVYQAQAFKKIADVYFKEFIFDSKPSKDSNKYIQVDDKNNPLHKKWVHEAILKEFENEPLYKSEHSNAVVRRAINTYYFLLVNLRKVKILPNPATWVKNITGGEIAHIFNGNFIAFSNPKAFLQSVAGRKKMIFNGERTQFTKEIFKDAAEAGVLSTDINLVTMGYIDDMYKYIDEGSDIKSQKSFLKYFNLIKDKGANTEKEFGKRYAQVDDYTKAMAVFVEKESIAKKIYGKKFELLNDKERLDVLRVTGNQVKSTYPTHSRLPTWFKYVAKSPLGDFLSFQFEAHRTFFTSMAIAYNDARVLKTGKDRNGNPLNDVQKKAYGRSFRNRMMGMSAVVGSDLLIKHGLTALRSIFSDDDEEEILLKEEVKKVKPFWTDNNIIVEEINESGEVRFFDYSGQQPYSDTISILHGDVSSLGNIFDLNMMVQLADELYKGESAFGTRIWKADDNFGRKLLGGFKHFVKAFTPPLVTSMEYAAKKKKENDPEWGSAGDWLSLGLSMSTFRKYNYNIHDKVKSLADNLSDKSMANRLGKSEDERDVLKRLNNLHKMREAIKVSNLHYNYATKKGKINPKLEEKIEAMDYVINLNFSKEEKDAFLYSSDEEYIEYLEYVKNNIDLYLKDAN